MVTAGPANKCPAWPIGFPADRGMASSGSTVWYWCSLVFRMPSYTFHCGVGFEHGKAKKLVWSQEPSSEGWTCTNCGWLCPNLRLSINSNRGQAISMFLMRLTRITAQNPRASNCPQALS
jgi:hypothetical protein